MVCRRATVRANGIRKFLQRFGFADRFAAFAAEKIIDAVARDAAEPRAKFVAFAQMAELFPRGDEGFLREIFALAETAGGAVSQRADERLIARNDLAEGVAVAGQGSADQFSVVVDCDRHHVWLSSYRRISGRKARRGDKQFI